MMNVSPDSIGPIYFNDYLYLIIHANFLFQYNLDYSGLLELIEEVSKPVNSFSLGSLLSFQLFPANFPNFVFSL